MKTTTSKKNSRANIGIAQEDLQTITQYLSVLLADEYVLYTKTRNAHWNVEGHDFHSKHVFFESQFNQLDEVIDSVAERIRKLGHYTPATLKEFLELTHLTEKRIGVSNDSLGYITDLLADHESIIIHLRELVHIFGEKYEDPGTEDFLTSLLETHESMAWFLRAHLA